MDFNQAKELLSTATRYECRDHAFGDCEVVWEKDGKEIAGGYFGRDSSVWVAPPWMFPIDHSSFSRDEARELRKCGSNVEISRNDETGPDTYIEGFTMHGLTLEGVRQELTNEQ